MRARDVMSRVVIVEPLTPLRTVASLLATRGVEAALVAGPLGQPLGIITQADLARALDLVTDGGGRAVGSLHLSEGAKGSLRGPARASGADPSRRAEDPAAAGAI
jgi:CBS domain-containing protein